MSQSVVPETQFSHNSKFRPNHYLTPKKQAFDTNSTDDSPSGDSINESLLMSPEMVTARYGNKFYPACKIGDGLYRWDENGGVEMFRPSDITDTAGTKHKSKNTLNNAPILPSTRRSARVPTSSKEKNHIDSDSKDISKVSTKPHSGFSKGGSTLQHNRSDIDPLSGSEEHVWVLVQYRPQKWYPAILVQDEQHSATIRWKCSGDETVVLKAHWKFPQSIRKKSYNIEVKSWGEWLPAVALEEFEGGFVKVQMNTDRSIDFRPIKETRVLSPASISIAETQIFNETVRSDDDRTPEQKFLRRAHETSEDWQTKSSNASELLHESSSDVINAKEPRQHLEEISNGLCAEKHEIPWASLAKNWVLVQYAPKKWYPGLLLSDEIHSAKIQWKATGDEKTVFKRDWKHLTFHKAVSYDVEVKAWGNWILATAIQEFDGGFVMLRMESDSTIDVRPEKEIRQLKDNSIVHKTQVSSPIQSNSEAGTNGNKTPEKKNLQPLGKQHNIDRDGNATSPHKPWVLSRYRSKYWYPALLHEEDTLTTSIKWKATGEVEVLLKSDCKQLNLLQQVNYHVEVRNKGKWQRALALEEYEGNFVKVRMLSDGDIDIRAHKEIRKIEHTSDEEIDDCSVADTEHSNATPEQAPPHGSSVGENFAENMVALNPETQSIKSDSFHSRISNDESVVPSSLETKVMSNKPKNLFKSRDESIHRVQNAKNGPVWVTVKYSSKFYPAHLVSEAGNKVFIEWPTGGSEMVSRKNVQYLHPQKSVSYHIEANIHGKWIPATVMQEFSNGWFEVRKELDNKTFLISESEIKRIQETQSDQKLLSKSFSVSYQTPERSAKKKRLSQDTVEETQQYHTSRKLFDVTDATPSGCEIRIGDVYRTIDLDPERFQHEKSIGTDTPKKTHTSLQKKSHFIQITGLMNALNEKGEGKVIGDVLHEVPAGSHILKKSGIVKGYKMTELLLKGTDRPLIFDWKDINHIFVWDDFETEVE